MARQPIGSAMPWSRWGSRISGRCRGGYRGSNRTVSQGGDDQRQAGDMTCRSPSGWSGFRVAGAGTGHGLSREVSTSAHGALRAIRFWMDTTIFRALGGLHHGGPPSRRYG